MTNSKLGLSRLIWILGAGLCLAHSATACSEDAQPSSSSSTNWLSCDDDADCNQFAGAHCGDDGICRDEDDEPIPLLPQGQGGSSGGSAGTGGRTSSGGVPAVTGGAPAGGSQSEGGVPGTGGALGGAAGSSEVGGEAGATSTAVSGGMGGSGGAVATGGSGAVVCLEAEGGGFGYALPEYDRSCQVDDDCFVGSQTINCCGSSRVMAFNVSEEDAYAAYESACRTVATCDCLGWLEAEDGTRITKGGVVAECIDDVCRATCTAENCALTEDCSAADECVTSGGACIYIDPNLLIDLCRLDDGSCGPCSESI